MLSPMSTCVILLRRISAQAVCTVHASAVVGSPDWYMHAARACTRQCEFVASGFLGPTSRVVRQCATPDRQGDTAECRRLQTDMRRRRQRLDGLPPWDAASEARLAALLDRVQRALCFAAVKH